MHEISIARQIAARVLSEAESADASAVLSVEVEVGDLAFLDADSLELWICRALGDGCGKDASVKVNVVRSTLSCRGCGYDGSPDLPEGHDHHLPLPPLECPRCASPDIDLNQQKDCLLKRVELRG